MLSFKRFIEWRSQEEQGGGLDEQVKLKERVKNSLEISWESHFLGSIWIFLSYIRSTFSCTMYEKLRFKAFENALDGCFVPQVNL